MFQKNDNQLGRRFLKEALPLISTYFSGESVQLSGMSTSVVYDPDSESFEFSQYIRFRHAIALCKELFPIVQRIESSLSSVSQTTRTETRGVICGRLDIPRYVARRATSFTWPKRYPILITTENASTPENQLVVQVFRTLLHRLPISQFPANYAETILGHRCKSWILCRMKRDPWATISCASSLSRLYMEACRRIARRQTGNEQAYSALVALVREWCLVGDEFTETSSSDKFVDLLLAFPADQSFFDRIYEIWCIRKVADTFLEIGGKLVDGPSKMTDSNRKPIYTFDFDSIRIEIWFQCSLPSENAEWIYESTGKSLRGIPDITVVANRNHRLIIDAKNRMVTGSTRSEETYKMLGYFENFRKTLGAETNWGVLAFVSLNGFSRSIKAGNGRSLALISAHPITFSNCKFSDEIEIIFKSWLDRIRSSVATMNNGSSG